MLKFFKPKFLIRYYDHSNRLVKLLLNYIYDFKNYVKYSGTIKSNSKDILKGKIIIQYHAIEKGMSLMDRRRKFGSKNLELLIIYLNKYEQLDSFLPVCPVYLNGLVTINKLFQFLDPVDVKVEDLSFFNSRIKYINNKKQIIQEVSINEIKKFSNIDYENFLKSRKSIRYFTDKNVDLNVLHRGIDIARNTPSVCNRQGWRVKIVDEHLISKSLEAHNGNRGFGHYINKLLVITMDTSYFEGANERNQMYIDGGLFSINLINSFHSLGLGTIPLNWSADRLQDKKLKNILEIKNKYTVIMLLGLGYMPENNTVPISEKIKHTDILI
mgnify:CR=1 FL=1|tara:strand:+ start:3043 stop:4023 length:981 start_codon:yes stop_codon:yes gene_type:complete